MTDAVPPKSEDADSGVQPTVKAAFPGTTVIVFELTFDGYVFGVTAVAATFALPPAPLEADTARVTGDPAVRFSTV